MTYLRFFILFVIFSACNPKTQNKYLSNMPLSNNDSILVTYHCGPTNFVVAMSCEKLASIQEQHPKNRYSYIFPEEISDELIDASFEDNSVLNGIELDPVPIDLIDTFIVDCNVLKRIDELLEKKVIAPDFSEDARMYITIKRSNGNYDYLCFDHFPNRIKYNGQTYSMDKELLFLLRYHSGYYSWFDKTEIGWFDELQDTVWYRKALEQIETNKHK